MVFNGSQIGLHAHFQLECLYVLKHFNQGHHTQQLISLTMFVIEVSCLQFWICQLIAFKGHGIVI